MDKSFIKNFFKGFTSTSIGSVIAIAFHFLSIMIMTRYVAKEALGLYFLLVAVVSYLNIIGGLGLNLTLVKFVSGEDNYTQKRIVGSIFFVRLISILTIGIVFFLISRFILSFFDPKLEEFSVLLIVMFAFTNIEELFLNLLQGRQQYVGYASVQVLSAVLRCVLLFLLRSQLSFQYLIYVEISVLLTSILIQAFMSRSVLQNLSYRSISLDTLKSTSRFSAPLYLNNVLTVIYDKSSTIIIGLLLNPVSVAAFEIALKVPDGFMRVFNSFIVVYFPSLSKLFAKGDREGAHKFMNHSLVLLSTAILFCVLIAFLFSKNIILLLFSEDYIEVSTAFGLLMLNFFLRSISNIQGYSLVSAGHSSAPVKANIFSITVNIVSCFLLIPRFGYIGAVYALLLMNITSQVLYLLELRKVGLMPEIRSYFKPILMFAGITALYLVIGQDNILLKLLLLGLYLLLSWLFIKEIQNLFYGAFSFWVRRKPKVDSI